MSGANSRATDWRIITSSGASLGTTKLCVAIGGITGRLYISKDFNASFDSPAIAMLSYKGAGLGIGAGPSPVDFSGSTHSMPSGGDIYHGPLSTGDITLRDLAGVCVVRVISAGFFAGVAATRIFFRPATTVIPALCKAIGTVPSFGGSTRGVSIVDYVCYMQIDRVNAEKLEPTESSSSGQRAPNFQTIPPALTLPSDSLFDFDRADLKPVAEQSLKQAVPLITKQRVRLVTIEGHTDSKGTAEYNLTLSAARANAVKDWFVARGVPEAGSFIATGLGETRPIAPNRKPDGSDNPDGRRKNRRVSIILTP